VRDGIAGETVTKLMHDEIGILRRYGLDKRYVCLTIKIMRHIGHSDLK
jgi:hypothetical protein